MLLSRAKAKAAAGLAIIANGHVRFLDLTGTGYDRAPSILRFGGRPSGGTGPITMQAKGRVFNEY